MATREERIQQGYRDLFDRVWSAVDDEVTRTFGFPWTTSPAARALAEQSFALRIQDSSLDPTDPADRALLEAHFTKHAREHAQAALGAALANLPVLKKVRIRKPKVTGEPFKRPGVLARNLELAWFVVERVIPFDQLLHGRVKLGHRNRDGIPWDALANEWNALSADPRRHLRSGRTLSREYYRAVANSHLVRNLLDDLQRGLDDARKEVAFGLHILRVRTALPPASHARAVLAESQHEGPRKAPRFRRLFRKLERGAESTRAVLAEGLGIDWDHLERRQLAHPGDLDCPRWMLFIERVMRVLVFEDKDNSPLRHSWLPANRAGDRHAVPPTPPPTSPRAKPGRKASLPRVGRKARAKSPSTSRTSLPSR